MYTFFVVQWGLWTDRFAAWASVTDSHFGTSWHPHCYILQKIVKYQLQKRLKCQIQTCKIQKRKTGPADFAAWASVTDSYFGTSWHPTPPHTHTFTFCTLNFALLWIFLIHILPLLHFVLCSPSIYRYLLRICHTFLVDLAFQIFCDHS